jgi:hypothetical protein
MRWTSLVLGSVVTLFLVVTSTLAVAYEDVGHDAEGDSTEESGAYDLRSSVRSVVRGPNHRNLRVATRTYEADFWVGSYVYIDAKLDARGGLAADAILHAWILDMSGSGCQLESRSGRVLRRGTLRFLGEGEPSEGDRFDGVSCRVPVHPLHPTKRIRWKVRIIHGNGEPVFDVAPDAAMYG